ncbi:MAG: hypothetical protein L3J20_07215 [Flavobacteriaceae bacterium]|nr:hypothetical protein [Flavobacteriaceae bacterium]
MKNLFSYLIIIIVIISCKQNNHRKLSYLDNHQDIPNLIGNYYSIYKYEDESGKIETIDYNEFYISKDKIYGYVEPAGYISPREYIIVNDSIFFGGKKLTNFGGKIKSTIDDNIIFQFDSITEVLYHRIKNGITLEYFVKKKTSEKKYRGEFYKRLDRNKPK